MDDPTATRPTRSATATALNTIWNVPNQLTVARLVLSLLCFFFLALNNYLAGLILFAIAAGTDWVDGYWARRYGQITQLGRIMDPFADKIIICGTFVFLAAVPRVYSKDGLDASPSEIWAWMAVLIIARELLVTALRSFLEEHGTDFSAQWVGKWKMALQCAAAAISLWRLWYYQFDITTLRWEIEPAVWSTWVLRLSVWAAVAITAYSGWSYVETALRFLKRPA